jgi:hypothetical protein
MAMNRFVHIGFAFHGVPKILDLEPVITTVGDWIRYSALSWIVWTDKPVGEIYFTLRRYLDAQDQVLVVKLDMLDSFGTLSPWIWEWINSKTGSTTVVTGRALEEALGLPKPKQ